MTFGHDVHHAPTHKRKAGFVYFVFLSERYDQNNDPKNAKATITCLIKKKKEEASPQGKSRAMWGEEAKPLEHKNDAERKSDL